MSREEGIDMTSNRRSLVLSVSVSLVIAVSACGGGEGDVSDDVSVTSGAQETGDELARQSSGDPGGGQEAPDVPDDATQVGDVGETLQFGSGHRATVHAVEMNVRGAVSRRGSVDTVEVALIDAEVCAGTVELDLRLPRAGNFSLYRVRGGMGETATGSGGRSVTFDGESTFSSGDPGAVVGPDQCVRGPVIVRAIEQGGFTAVVFDTRLFGESLPEGQRVRLAWRLLETS